MLFRSENADKGKSILEAPPKLEKKETRNPRTKKGNNQKSKQNKAKLKTNKQKHVKQNMT